MTSEELIARIDERQAAMNIKIDNILLQTAAINGRVTNIELWRSKLRGVWATVVIVATAISVIVGIVIKLV